MYNITPYNNEGIDVGRDRQVMAYLYGLSDFWAYVFEDASKTNLLLEASSLSASEIYNKFLQLTSQISLEDISVQTESQIRLVFIKESDKVAGLLETYKLPSDTLGDSKLLSAKYLANRPLLPTSTLENEAHFRILHEDNTISFYKPLSQLGFPVRLADDGTKEYAVWAVDARLDDSLIYKSFAKLIKLDPQSSTETFKSLVYGLYYLYTNGPNIQLIKRGLNLVLGIPLARETETVIDIQSYADLDQYVVITDLNSYVIPYGLSPTVEIGDTLSIHQELSEWIEVKDYVNDGDWWINFLIPENIIPNVPAEVSRYATKGSYADYLMKEYLRRHTFLVNVKTVAFKNLQNFAEFMDIIQYVKPTHTTPLYVWTVPIQDEDIGLEDVFSTIAINTEYCEPLLSGLPRFIRDSSDPLSRGCPQFTRFCAPKWLDKWSGRDADINGHELSMRGGVVDGYISPQRQFAEPTDKQKAWEKNTFFRGSDNYHPARSKLAFRRDTDIENVSGDGVLVGPSFSGYRKVYMYTTTVWDVASKLNTFGKTVPNQHWFTLFKPTSFFESINSHTVNGQTESGWGNFLVEYYDLLFSRTDGVNLLSVRPPPSYESFKPEVTDVGQDDFLLFIHTDDYALGVWWVTKNQLVEGWPYIPVTDGEELDISFSGQRTRGVGQLGNPSYVIRNRGSAVSLNRGGAVNVEAINETTSQNSIEVKYSDTTNEEHDFNRTSREFVTKTTL